MVQPIGSESAMRAIWDAVCGSGSDVSASLRGSSRAGESREALYSRF